MKTIKAIVLTCDKYRIYTDHMIRCYEKLWPNHPFVFHVPYQQLSPTIEIDGVVYKKSPSDIKGTVLSLLSGLHDEEIIYWCIDDKYPINLDKEKIVNAFRCLSEKNLENLAGLLYCRCRGLLNEKNLTGFKFIDDQGLVWLERNNYKQIWIHQFLKVKVLRYLFESFPQEIPTAKQMDYFKEQVRKPEDHRLFVTSVSLGFFGESTSGGVITRNCLESMKAYNLKIPPSISDVVPCEEIFLGDSPRGFFTGFYKRLTKRSG